VFLFISFLTGSRAHTVSLVQWVLGTVFSEVERKGREADAEVKNDGTISPGPPIHVFMT
jgi:hypothetical protein